MQHRPDCTFGPGFYRIVLEGDGRRYCQTEKEVRLALAMQEGSRVRHVQRDACLDEPDDRGVVDGELFLSLPRTEAMAMVGIDNEADYARAYRALYDAILERDKRTEPGLERPSVVIKKRGVPVTDV